MSVIGNSAAGAISGMAASVPMTFVMKQLHGESPWSKTDPLPPRQITEEFTERAGVRDEMDEGDVRAASLGAHLGYGATTGSLYGMIANRLPIPRIASGVLFALFVWTVSYLGWLPAMRILPPATEHPGRQNALMIVAHIVWGASMGLALTILSRRRS